MKKITYILILCLQQYLPAQTAEADFTKLNAALLNAADLLVETEYKVYENYFVQSPKEVSYGLMKQKGYTIYQSIATLQVLMNDKITLHLDTADKILVLSDPVNIAEQKKQALQVDLKSIMNEYRSMTYKDLGDHAGVYYIEYKDDAETEFSRCDVYIDRKKNCLSKMVLYYDEEMDVNDEAVESKKEKPRLEIIFKKIDTSPRFENSDFEEARFIQRIGTKISPAPAYKGFRLIDNRYYSRLHK